MEIASEVYAETYRENSETLTPAEFAQHAAGWRAHFKDFTVTVDELISCGDRVITRVTYRGTHIGDFRMLPATGRSFELTGIDIFEFAHSRVVQHWHETDHLQMFQELEARTAQLSRSVAELRALGEVGRVTRRAPRCRLGYERLDNAHGAVQAADCGSLAVERKRSRPRTDEGYVPRWPDSSDGRRGNGTEQHVPSRKPTMAPSGQMPSP